MTAFPIRIENPPEHTAPLPKVADVVVIGGGVIGIMTAWFAARKGLRVVVIEKGRIAGEQSSRNWGWIRQQGRDPAELPIMIEANSIWRGLDAPLRAEIGLKQTGTLFLAHNDAELAKYEAWLPHAKHHGLDTRLLSSREVAQMMPTAARSWTGALWTASDMRAEPWVAVPRLARAAVEQGVQIIENCAARGLDRAAGALRGVVTEHGTIACEKVVLAGGAWSSLFLRRHGIAIPQLSVRATVAATHPVPDVYAGGAVDDRFAFRRREDGGYTLAPEGFHEMYIGPDAFRAFRRYLPQLLANPTATALRPFAPRGYPDAWGTPRRWRMDRPGPFEAMRILDPAPNAKKVAQLIDDLRQTFPALGQVGVAAAWAGMIDTLPDVVPVVDHADTIPGLIIATGMCGHGFGIGPGFGRVVADMVAGDDPGHDLSRFRLGRFTDGSRLVAGPTL
ncbi:FAD-binding oxidoreductase [Octadecabacter sp. G9-8]|uniref:FAD-binding oxidoreductase n=1 Tax=Octadecabacter dasysiphoniae TaxID=2909341 RepID=A0ABS9D1Q2_9RHOB|nr:FAD-binding oxidoreductase [Octadecabacter dasysiphoniae]MCF2872565.1 FAD-binding oxidoreductase [Octadecabacter dasysiphoniae]